MLSVIIPCFNSERSLPQLLKSIKIQDLSCVQLIFVDNGSTDSTAQILKRFCCNQPGSHYLYYDDVPSSYAARNYGVLHSIYNFLLFIDSDCILSENFICYYKSIIRSIDSNSVICGDVKFSFINPGYPNFFELYDSHFFLSQSAYASNKLCATANFGTSKSIFTSLNGFSILSTGSDHDFCRRLSSLENSFIFSKKCFVIHPARNTFNQIIFKIKRLSYGRFLRSSKSTSFNEFLSFLPLKIFFKIYQLKLPFYTSIPLFLVAIFFNVISRSYFFYFYFRSFIGLPFHVR